MTSPEADIPEVRHWFDTRTGDMIVGRAAYDEVLETTPPVYPDDIQPLGDILLAQNFNVDDFSERYPDVPFHRRSKETYISYGHWVLNILREAEPDPTLKSTYFMRMQKLGLGMSYPVFIRQFGNIWQMRDTFDVKGAAEYGKYREWSVDQFVENAQELEASLGGRKPFVEDFENWARIGQGPGPRIISESVFGGVAALVEFLGYPDIRKWEREDYVKWGVRFMKANEGTLPTKLMCNILSKRRRGPSDLAIRNYFPEGYDYYKQEILGQYHEERLRIDALLNQHSKTIGALSEMLGVEALHDPEQSAALLARYLLLRSSLGVSNPAALARLAQQTSHRTITSEILQRNQSITAGAIEMYAEEYGVYDLVWPPFPDSDKHLKIHAKEIRAARRKEAMRQRQRSHQKAKPVTGQE